MSQPNWEESWVEYLRAACAPDADVELWLNGGVHLVGRVAVLAPSHVVLHETTFDDPMAVRLDAIQAVLSQ